MRSMRRGRAGASNLHEWLVTALKAIVVMMTGVGAALVSTAGTGASAAPSRAGGSVPLVAVNAAQRLPEGTKVVAALAPAVKMHLDVTLRPRDPSALAAFVAAVSTPGSPEYRRFLAKGAFGPRFGATLADVAKVRSGLRALGLTPGNVSSDQLSIPVTASASAVDTAFHVALSSLRLPSGRVAFANTEPVRLPATIAPIVQGVIGLSNVVKWHSQMIPGRKRAHPSAPAQGPVRGAAQRATAIRQPSSPSAFPNIYSGAPCSAASSTASSSGSYAANQLAQAYGFNHLYQSGLTGQGVTVGLYELEPFSSSDIATFESCYGISTSVSTVQVDGGAGTGAGSGEAALDIENVASLAPSSSIVVYEGPNSGNGPYDVAQAIANADVAKIVSTSWGACEPLLIGSGALSSEEALFEQAAAQGQTVLAAAGDAGSEDCNGQVSSSSAESTALAVDDPASDPYVTGVGGTTMTALGPPPTEQVWNEAASTAGAGGGGISARWTMPSWQRAPGVMNTYTSGSPCGAPTGQYCREVPDVSAVADPYDAYVVYYTGTGTGTTGWQAIGGTSGATPLWAALLADVAQSCPGPAPSTPSLGFVNPALYSMAAAADLVVNDITSGNNDYTGTNNGAYPATTGYDMASGLGTPIGGGVRKYLCALETSVTSVTAQPVSQPNVTAATQTYQVGFVTSAFNGALAKGVGTITIDASATASGTVFPATASDYVVKDLTSNQSATVTLAPKLLSSGQEATMTTPIAVSAGDKVQVDIGGVKNPAQPGDYAYDVSTSSNPAQIASSPTFSVVASSTPPPPKGAASGYRFVASDGGIFSFNAPFYGSMGGKHLNAPIVGMAADPATGGYWFVASDGGIFSFNAPFYGSMGGKRLNAPIVGMAADPATGGYWFVASDGGIFSFNAPFYGSMGGKRLNAPIVGMASTPIGGGYWFVASDGGIFSFGDAKFYGSMGDKRLNAPIVGMAGM